MAVTDFAWEGSLIESFVAVSEPFDVGAIGVEEATNDPPTGLPEIGALAVNCCTSGGNQAGDVIIWSATR